MMTVVTLVMICHLAKIQMYYIMTELWATLWSPQKVKNRTTVWSSSSTPGYLSEENENTNCKRPLCSLQHYLQQPRQGRNLSAHRRMKGQRRCDTYSHWPITQPQRRMKSCHLQQHGFGITFSSQESTAPCKTSPGAFACWKKLSWTGLMGAYLLRGTVNCFVSLIPLAGHQFTAYTLLIRSFKIYKLFMRQSKANNILFKVMPKP